MSEREQLIEILNNTKIRSRTLGDLFYKSVIEKIADQLLENDVIVPSEVMKKSDDVVEVVRCKDCKYFIDREGKCYGQDIRSEEGHDCYKDENDFCSYGERRCNE